jgi:hypothetical protein
VENPDPKTFIERWKNSGAAERANYQLFLSELCDVLGVPRPDPTKPDDAENAYVFERSVTFHHADGSTSTGRIDLYKRGHFVLEAKQGVEKREQEEALSETGKAKAKATKKGTATRGSALWDEAMLKAQGQAEQYARALPASEGRPPLLIVVDVGHSIELYSEFTCTGGTYVPFPDPRRHRLSIDQLSDPEVRETLRLAWIDPKALDPTRRTARVTREIAEKLGRLAQSLEKSGHTAEAVATFLMRALFTMFAEDVELLPKDSFINLLKSLLGHTQQFVPMVEELWGRMKTGGFSTVLREKIVRFNGGLFENATALPLTEDQFDLLIEASNADWRDVEPAIFGTLLERALDPIERHKLGAHYTPRAYVERLVVPTIVEPLRAEWDAVKAAAVTLDRQGKQKEAAAEVQRFHRRLCEIRILDPACGSGNFLYVTLEHLKRLEGEVLNALDRLGHEQAALEMAGFTVDPHQLLGLEVNPRAAAIAELVLWIGYLQWHFRTRGRVTPPEPIIKNFHNIECRDAVLAWDSTEPAIDEQGKPITHWDGRTTKSNPVTNEQVPDDTARTPVLNYIDPRASTWPQADFIIGNPPYLGKGERMREALGDGYVKALRAVYSKVPGSADFVMYWWHKAALAVASTNVVRFGFITTNSLRQSFNRRIVEEEIDSKRLSLQFAIPDHPWVDSKDGAAVRIAMTVASAGESNGRLLEVLTETETDEGDADVTLVERTGHIQADLTIGAAIAGMVPLKANEQLSINGMMLAGRGFVISRAETEVFGLGSEKDIGKIIKPLRNGRDLTGKPRDAFVIDAFGLTAEQVRKNYPAIYQHLLTKVKPERDASDDEGFRKNWWIFGRPRPAMRAALKGLNRFIVTVETAKHRIFQFQEARITPEHKLVVIASDDAHTLGILSSRIHGVYALAAGSWLGVGNDPVYAKSHCFEPFPFPNATDEQRTAIRDFAEAIDAHRKGQQAQHPALTLTDIYNVLEKLRAGTALSAKEQVTHEKGLVSVLRQLHDDLDAGVAAAYGLPGTTSDEEILAFLCKLNAERAAEERSGLIRWLRPSFQHPEATTTQATMGTADIETAAPAKVKTTGKLLWPKTLAEQAQAVRAALTAGAGPVHVATLAKNFKGTKTDRLEDILETLASLGQARALADGRYVAL